MRPVPRTVFTDVLEQAIRAEGSAQAIAFALRVPEGTLERWRAGRAMMPVRAFVQVLQMVKRHEEAHPPAPEGPAADGEKLTFKAGKILARCMRCDGVEFARSLPHAALKYTSRLVCRTCRYEVIHGDLIAELAREVSLTAAAGVARVRKKRAP